MKLIIMMIIGMVILMLSCNHLNNNKVTRNKYPQSPAHDDKKPGDGDILLPRVRYWLLYPN